MTRHPRPRPTPVAVWVAALIALLAGCGVGATDRPEPVSGPRTGGPTPAGPPAGNDRPVPVYLERDGRLVAVLRRGDTAADAVAALTAGPTAAETAAGLSTALGPGPITLPPARQWPGTAVLEVTDEFAALAGASQLVAVGQVVWTATGVCCAGHVELLLDGRRLSLPTDDGLVRRPVSRADYRSIAPG